MSLYLLSPSRNGLTSLSLAEVKQADPKTAEHFISGQVKVNHLKSAVVSRELTL